MSEAITKYTSLRRLYSISRKAAALGLSMASVSSGAAAAAPKLTPLDKLPGAPLTVTNAQQQQLKASTVRVNFQDGNQGENCTGNKLNYVGISYVTAAAHCLSFVTGGYYGLLSSTDNETAVNLMATGTVEGSIFSPNSANKRVRGKQLAQAAGISVGLRRGDDALVSMDASPAMAAVPALTYNPAIAPPTPGQQVALYGVPSPSFAGVGAIGRYLGRMNLNQASPLFEVETVDAVAIGIKNDAQNPCFIGGSGQTDVLADRHQLGDLTMAVNMGYGPHNEVIHPDPSQRYTGDPRSVWMNTENTLSVTIPASRYNELCYFAVRDAGSLPDLVGGLSVSAAQISTTGIYG